MHTELHYRKQEKIILVLFEIINLISKYRMIMILQYMNHNPWSINLSRQQKRFKERIIINLYASYILFPYKMSFQAFNASYLTVSIHFFNSLKVFLKFTFLYLQSFSRNKYCKFCELYLQADFLCKYI